ncbi:hypothetical protein [Pseudomonas sp. Ost2]|uniref:hypothetical protein n=1 Tax=Pseudomonas sp. Ost2 TaxID=2678260 RepID=UPI001BB3C935|nr:hypothetical protein [Pseudomonas sp. Ost2]
MFFYNYIKYRVELRKQKKDAKELEKKAPPDCEQAYESGQWADYMQKVELSDQWRSLLITRYLEREADSLGVFLPSRSNAELYARVAWDDHPDEPYYLLPPGLKVVRDAVREERKHRREFWGFWITSFTGLGGVIIGVLSLWPK